MVVRCDNVIDLALAGVGIADRSFADPFAAVGDSPEKRPMVDRVVGVSEVRGGDEPGDSPPFARVRANRHVDEWVHVWALAAVRGSPQPCVSDCSEVTTRGERSTERFANGAELIVGHGAN